MSFKMKDDYIRCDTKEEFEEFAKSGGWENARGFTKSMCVTFRELKGKWFQIVGGRVFLKED